jgi:hypothetical protein
MFWLIWKRFSASYYVFEGCEAAVLFGAEARAHMLGAFVLLEVQVDAAGSQRGPSPPTTRVPRRWCLPVSAASLQQAIGCHM